jgi:hypothetical protein
VSVIVDDADAMRAMSSRHVVDIVLGRAAVAQL